jgi:hypothetical protein
VTEDPRITSARRLLAEHHQPITMTPGELWTLLAWFQRRTAEVLAVLARSPARSRCAPATEPARERA